MANVPRALDTSNAWSPDDSDEETHFREMVQLSMYMARRLEPKGTGDDAVSEDAANDRVARDTVLDSSDDDATEDDAVEDDAVEDDDADAARRLRGSFLLAATATIFGGFADLEAESLRAPTTPDDASQEQHALCDDTPASTSAAPAMERPWRLSSSPRRRARHRRRRRRKKGTTKGKDERRRRLRLKGSLSSPFGSFSVPNESRDRSATFHSARAHGRRLRRPRPRARIQKEKRKKSARPTESRPPCRPPAARRADAFRAT